jgi:uncharacterized protein (TIGR03083 family)
VNHLDAIRRDVERFYASAAGADPGLPVPSCPDWTVGDLVWHLGEVHWFWATDIEQRAAGPQEVEEAKPPRPGAHGEVLAWARAQADRLLALLEATPDDVVVWTWALDESDHTVGFVRRHQVQEAAVHRWDLQNAVTGGAADPIEPDVAADSIDEFLAVTLPWCVHADKPLAGTVHVHCTDTDGEWFVDTHGRTERVHAKGDVAIRGSASAILLALYGRAPLGELDVIGDAALAQAFVDAMNTA